MRSLYRPGTSVLHRLNAGFKLIALAVAVTLITVFDRTPISIAIATLLVLVLYFTSEVKPRELLRQLWSMKFLILIIVIPQLYFAGLEKGLANTSVVFLVILLASLVSRTTKTSELVDVIHRITKSDNFALLIALSLNAIPQVEATAKAIVEAGKARGVRISAYRQLISLFVVSLRSADQYAEALAARGVRV